MVRKNIKPTNTKILCTKRLKKFHFILTFLFEINSCNDTFLTYLECLIGLLVVNKLREVESLMSI